MKAKSARRLATLCSPIPDCGIGLFLCLRLVFCFGATNRDQSRPIATFSARPIATDCDRLRPIATNRDQSRPIATDCDQSRPIATNRDQSRPIATDCDFFGATNRDRVRPIATESGGPPPPFFGRRAALDPRSLNFFATHCAFLQKFCFFATHCAFLQKCGGGWVESHKKLL